MNYPSTPEFVAFLESIAENSDTETLGDKITTIQVQKASDDPDGEVVLDIRNFEGNNCNLMIRIPFPVFAAAFARATLNSERNP